MPFGYKGVLFLCRGNSVRSQMAEGLFRDAAKDSAEVWSAGDFPIGLDSRSVAVMKEIGIDISGHVSKRLIGVPLEKVDLVITLCGDENDPCPAVSGKMKKLHWPLPDPYLSEQTGADGLDSFRAVRDELKRKVDDLLNS